MKGLSRQYLTAPSSIYAQFEEVKLYPNPVEYLTNIKITDPDIGTGTISIYDLIGTKMDEIAFSKENRTETVPVISTNFFKPGTYVVIVNFNYKRSVLKLIKL